MKAFDSVKNLISRDTILSYYDRTKPVILQVDASHKGIGVALVQENRPIAFASKAMTSAESRYANIERELLAVVFGCTKFHTYLYGREFVTESDHRPLEQIQKKNLTKAPPRLQRMLLQLQPYDMTIKYKPGKEMVLADALSRLNPMVQEPIPGLDIRIHEMIQVSVVKLTEIQQETAKDTTLQLLQQQVIQGWPYSIKGVQAAVKPYWSMRDDLGIQDGVLLMGSRMVIPESLRKDILEQIHAGHLGMEKSKLRAKGSVFWPGIYKDIEAMISACGPCQQHQRTQTKEPMMPMEIPLRPWHTIGADLFMHTQCWHLLVSDYYSKFPFVRKLPDLTAKTVVNACKGIFAEHGIPFKLVCDNGKQFDSHEFRTFAKQYGFEMVTSSPYYPRGHGLIERHVQTVKRVMTKCHEDDYDIHLALLALRSTPLDHQTPSPAELLANRKFNCLLPCKIPSPNNSEQIRASFEQRQTTSAQYYNAHSKEVPELLPGQGVHIQDPLTKAWEKGRILHNATTPRSYVVDRGSDQRPLRRNSHHLRPSCTPPKDVMVNRSTADQQVQKVVEPQTPVRPSVTSTGDTKNSPTRVSRVGRVINRPRRLDDYME